jgi:uncharacterized protein YndB with AHSA1/START domain
MQPEGSHMEINRIEKRVELDASVSRVWKALTDHREFGEWFRVKIDGPFKSGEISRGHVTYPGYERLKWEVSIQAIEPERYFAFTWHPYAVDPNADYSDETPTLVEFTLDPTANGMLLTVIESGFDKIPIARAIEAFRMNDTGWEIQMKNIGAYVAEKP